MFLPGILPQSNVKLCSRTQPTKPTHPIEVLDATGSQGAVSGNVLWSCPSKSQRCQTEGASHKDHTIRETMWLCAMSISVRMFAELHGVLLSPPPCPFLHWPILPGKNADWVPPEGNGTSAISAVAFFLVKNQILQWNQTILNAETSIDSGFWISN